MTDDLFGSSVFGYKISETKDICHLTLQGGWINLRTNFTEEIFAMAMKINEDCISCGACLPECPTESITEGDTIYVIDAATCVECEGHFDEPQCASVCPVECIEKA